MVRIGELNEIEKKYSKLPKKLLGSSKLKINMEERARRNLKLHREDCNHSERKKSSVILAPVLLVLY